MSKEWTAAVAQAELDAQRKLADEEIAEGRFDAVHAEAEANGRAPQAVQTQEFRAWMAARHATDEAWGAWAMAMDAKPAA